MKLSINYDLMEQIALSEKGYTLSRDIKQIAFMTVLSSALSCALNGENMDLQTFFLITLPIQAPMNMLYTNLISHQMLGQIKQVRALLELQALIYSLRDINVNTDLDLLQKSELYHKQYSLKHDEGKMPYILEEKYIMVPTVYDDDEQDISILQEHKVGSSVYVLSKGSPAKKLKIGGLAYNQ